MREQFEKWAVKEGVFAGESEDSCWSAWQAAYSAGLEAAAREIDTSTGPTGGWLDSPKAVAAAIRAMKREGQ